MLLKNKLSVKFYLKLSSKAAILHQGCINSSEVARLSFLAGLMSQEQCADYLNIERECGKS